MRAILITCGVLAAASAVRSAAAQGAPIFTLDLAGAPAGGFPAGIDVRSGNLAVVARDGRRMLRAASPSEFVVTLPQALPQDFTVTVDLVPKACCNPEDLAFEGTATRNRGTASAELLWHRNAVAVIGGGDAYQATMPADLAAATPGTLTHIVAVFEGPMVKLYTNGRRLYTLERKFVRSQAFRVTLGGTDADRQAVYLAALQIVPGALSPLIATSANQSAIVASGPATSGGGSISSAGSVGGLATAASPTTVAPGTSAGAIAQGPVATTQSATRAGTVAGGALPSRTVSLTGFTAAGGYGVLTGRSIPLNGFDATGGYGALAPRGIALVGFAATGKFGLLAPRTISLAGFAGRGTGSLETRTMQLSGFTATGTGSLAPRSITLAGFMATGNGSLVQRTISLTGFTASGYGSLLPRTIPLSGFTAAGFSP